MRGRRLKSARADYELARAEAYRDFYNQLKDVGQLTPAKASSDKPFCETTADIGRPPSAPSPEPQSPFARVLFRLYEQIMRAYKRSLENAGLPASIVVKRLAKHAESTYEEIYVARLEEFAQRAGFYANKALPPFYLGLLPANARGHTSRHFRQLEDDVLAATVAGRTISEGTTGSRQQLMQEGTLIVDGKGKHRRVVESLDSFDYASEPGRRNAIGAYIKHWTSDSETCSEASLARTARVDPADLSKWKKGLLPASSHKKARIEEALKNNKPPTPPPAKRSDT